MSTEATKTPGRFKLRKGLSIAGVVYKEGVMVENTLAMLIKAENTLATNPAAAHSNSALRTATIAQQMRLDGFEGAVMWEWLKVLPLDDYNRLREASGELEAQYQDEEGKDSSPSSP